MRNPQPGLYADVGPRKGLEEYPAVYLPRGHVTHLLPQDASPNKFGPALCKRTPGLFSFWLGTGNQSEYDIARSMPLCTDCNNIVREESE